MYTKKIFSLPILARWTIRETLLFFIIALIPTILYEVFDLRWLQVPWTPIALIGTAVAFVVGFQNNAAYERIWEARKIWGGIVNTSKTWGMMVMTMVTNNEGEEISENDIKKEVKILTYRHIAWLTALRYAMRQARPWENFDNNKFDTKWKEGLHFPESKLSLEESLLAYLSENELKYVLSKTNKQTAILYLQSMHIKTLKEKKLLWEFSFIELENVLKEFFTLQGQSERIKNFPYPRQYSTIGYFFVWVFIVLIPFGVLPQFEDIGNLLIINYPLIGKCFIWATIPFAVIVSWVFHTMERIGRVGENPFEGTATDVPISTISRGIEIDLRQMLDENPEDIPLQFPEMQNTQM
ncbi:bestrophin family protein [Formosa maritima]|uniref:Multidrug transporter n=1 Tax=Formosa maritima TaxID=2592046 RepID=A0A5D0G7F4_9FLAO|nr:bestrophin family ion channel [Formosa maritima]TYA54611.1 hypothetical protein FVF61_08695 [Formosa maritima]